MTFEVVLSLGRIADRNSGLAEGARRTATAIAKAFRGDVREIGSPSAVFPDDWSDCLLAAHSNLKELQASIDAAMDKPGIPIMVATTCAASIASIPVFARRHPEACLLWIDAHGDFNRPDTTGTGYLGGMVVAGVCGLWDTGHGAGLKPDNVVVVGGRDIDAAEGDLLAAHGVTVLPPSAGLLDRLVEIVGSRAVWIHVDWDVLEPGHVPADYSVPGGLLPSHVRAVFESFAGRILGIELTEYCIHEPSVSSEEHLNAILTMVEPAFAGKLGEVR